LNTSSQNISSLTVTSLTDTSLATNSFIFSSTGGLISSTGSAATDGQLLIGRTGNSPLAASLTAGSARLTVTPGAGSITLDVAATPTFTNVTVSTFTAKAFVYSDASKTLVTTANPANGQLLIGNGGNIPSLGTLTPGPSNNVIITNGAGTITIDINTTNFNVSSIVVSGDTAKAFVYSDASKAIVTTAAPSNGSLLIGSAGNIPVVATLTQGNNMQITNGAGSISIGTVGSPTFNAVTISGLNVNAFVYSGAAGLLTTPAAPINGQLLIGNTGGPPLVATLTAGASGNIVITNGGGSITIDTSANPSFTTITATATTNQILLGSASHRLTISSTAPAAAALTYTIPDVGSAARFVLSAAALTAKGFTYTDVNSLLAVTANPTNGQLLIGNGGNIPSVATLTAGPSNNVIITNGPGSITIDINTTNFNVSSIVVSGDTPKAFVYSDASKAIVTTSAPSNGQLLIGSTGNIPVVASLTQGSNIAITPGAGSITIATSGTPSFTSLTVSGLTANSFLYSGTGGLLTTTAAPTDGQLLIGSSIGAPAAATLTAGNNIIITNGHNSITVATSLNPSFTTVTATQANNQLILGSGNTVTLSATAPSSSRIYTFPDAGADANVVLTQGTQTILGTTNFRQAMGFAGSATSSTWTTGQVTTGGVSSQILTGVGGTSWFGLLQGGFFTTSTGITSGFILAVINSSAIWLSKAVTISGNAAYTIYYGSYQTAQGYNSVLGFVNGVGNVSLFGPQRFNFIGADASDTGLGPATNWYTDADGYAVLQLLPYQHGHAEICADCQYVQKSSVWNGGATGAYYSGNADGNLNILMGGGRLEILTATGVTPGTAIGGFTTVMTIFTDDPIVYMQNLVVGQTGNGPLGGRIQIFGAASSTTTGPHIAASVTGGTTWVVYQQYNEDFGKVHTCYNCGGSPGNWISAGITGNYLFTTATADEMDFQVADDVAAGSPITFITAMTLRAGTGVVAIPTALYITSTTNQLVFGGAFSTTLTVPTPSGARTVSLPDVSLSSTSLVQTNDANTLITSGTFVPFVQDSSNHNLTVTTQLGWYHQIGNQIFWYTNLEWSGIGGSAITTDALRITHLPKSSANTAGLRPVVTIMYTQGIQASSTQRVQLVGAMIENVNYVVLEAVDNVAGTTAAVTVAMCNHGVTDLQIGGFYRFA